MTYGCQRGKAPQYLANCCTPVSDVPARQRLRSSSRHHLDVPRHRLSTYDRRAFSVAGPSVWNSLPVELRDPDISIGKERKGKEEYLYSAFVPRNKLKQLKHHRQLQTIANDMAVLKVHVRSARRGVFQRYALYKSIRYITLHCLLLIVASFLTLIFNTVL